MMFQHINLRNPRLAHLNSDFFNLQIDHVNRAIDAVPEWFRVYCLRGVDGDMDDDINPMPGYVLMPLSIGELRCLTQDVLNIALALPNARSVTLYNRHPVFFAGEADDYTEDEFDDGAAFPSLDDFPGSKTECDDKFVFRIHDALSAGFHYRFPFDLHSSARFETDQFLLKDLAGDLVEAYQNSPDYKLGHVAERAGVAGMADSAANCPSL